MEVNTLPRKDKTVVIDLGIKDFTVTSDGMQIATPKYLQQSVKKLEKTKGVSNWNKARSELLLI